MPSFFSKEHIRHASAPSSRTTTGFEEDDDAFQHDAFFNSEPVFCVADASTAAQG
jgi:hypothetical protein